MELHDLESIVKNIEERNARVEIDKKWETSKTRRAFIALFTYLAISLYFYFLGIDNPFLNAVVPTLGFLLSTLSLPLIRKVWEKNQPKK